MLNQEPDVNSNEVIEEITQPPVIKEGKTIRWEYITPNGFQHWRIKSGVFQFTDFPKSDLDLLEVFDRVQESHEKGMIRYVNICQGCGQKFLSPTMILVPYYHKGCEPSRQSDEELLDILVELNDSDPDAFDKLIANAKRKKKGG